MLADDHVDVVVSIEVAHVEAHRSLHDGVEDRLGPRVAGIGRLPVPRHPRGVVGRGVRLVADDGIEPAVTVDVDQPVAVGLLPRGRDEQGVRLPTDRRVPEPHRVEQHVDTAIAVDIACGQLLVLGQLRDPRLWPFDVTSGILRRRQQVHARFLTEGRRVRGRGFVPRHRHGERVTGEPIKGDALQEVAVLGAEDLVHGEGAVAVVPSPHEPVERRPVGHRRVGAQEVKPPVSVDVVRRGDVAEPIADYRL